MAYQKYTDEQQAGFILQLEVAGYPDNQHAPLEVSKKKGAPSARTLKRWWKIRNRPEVDKVVQDIKKGLSDRLYELAQRIVDEMFEDLDTNGIDAARAAVPLGVVIDKLQLLEGKPTEIHKHDLDDAHERLNSRIAGYATRGGETSGNQRPIA